MVVVVGNLLGSDNGGILGIGERPVGDSGLCSGGQWGRDFEIPQLHTGDTRDTAVYWEARGSPNLHCTGEGDLISSSPIDSMNCPKQMCNYM